MTEPERTTSRPESAGASRAVRIMPWADAVPTSSDAPRAPRPSNRRPPVPPSGLIATGGFTEPGRFGAG
ncbi:MAG: hypothetical protein M3Z25_19855, partial [Actinomycetota bacterium]|nr:hypothetical protein [Actinomycetota bacterium]